MFFTIGFLSIVGFQACYLFFHWRIFKTKEYLTYSLYLFTTFIYFFILGMDQFLSPEHDKVLDFLQEWLKRPIAVLLYYLYYCFVVDFLEFRIKAPVLAQALDVTLKVLVASIFFFLISYFIFGRTLQGILYFGFNIVLFFISLYFVFALWRTKTRFSSYFLRGSLFALSGAFIANLLYLIFSNAPMYNGWVQLIAILSPMAGMLVEVYYFSWGLAFKSKQLEIEVLENKNKVLEQLERNQKLLLEKEEIRNKIAQDLHDDVGATLSSMQIYGDLAQIIWETKPLQSKEMVAKITEHSRELMARMGDIVWSLKPSDKEKNGIALRLKNYSNELLAAKEIACNFEIDEEICSKIDNPFVKKKHITYSKRSHEQHSKVQQGKKSKYKFYKKGNIHFFNH